MALTPIIPRRKVISTSKHEQAVTQFLRGFAADFSREMATYPAALPWKYPPPKTGPRAGGRRTGTLGRNWSARIRFTRSSVSIENPTSYGIYVQGPRPGAPRRRQTDVMRARGWPNVTDTGNRVYKRHKSRLDRAIR